jgi:hypothetical protein
MNNLYLLNSKNQIENKKRKKIENKNKKISITISKKQKIKQLL